MPVNKKTGALWKNLRKETVSDAKNPTSYIIIGYIQCLERAIKITYMSAVWVGTIDVKV